MSLKDFQIIEKLGEGAYSTVFKVRRLIDNTQYAIKRVKLNNLNQREIQNSLNQVRILASINHPNVISYKEAFIVKGKNQLCIVMEHADDGDLLAKIRQHEKKGTKFEEREVWAIVIQMIRGVKALHDHKVLHRDIKSCNFLTTKSGLVKVGDLNVSKAFESMCKTQTGTPYYASPEIWKEKSYDTKSDVWSLGCVVYELITLKPPFRANDMEGLFKKISRGFYTRLPPGYSDDLSIILKMMLQVAPHLRSSCEKLLQLSIIQKRFTYLPKQIIINPKPSKAANKLISTITVDESISSNQLKNRIKLPKSAYSINQYHLEEIPSQTESETRSVDLPFHQKPSPSKKLILPSINKTIDHTVTKIRKPSQLPIPENIVNKLLEPSLGSKHKYYQMKKSSQQHSPFNPPQKSPTKLKSNKVKQYQGRIKQLSTEVMHKILKQEKQKQSIKSIIGTN